SDGEARAGATRELDARVADEVTRTSGEDEGDAFAPSASTTTALEPERQAFAAPDDEHLRTQPGDRGERSLVDEAASFVPSRESSPAIPLDDSDIEAIEDDPIEDDGSTHIGAFPIDPDLAGQQLSADQLADQLDRQLA